MKSFTNLREAIDTATVQELLIYITNDAKLYKQRIQPIIKNLSNKFSKGTYDGIKAIKAFGYAVTDGLKSYEKEHGTKGWAKSIDKDTKKEIAKELVDYYSEEVTGE